MRSLTLLVSLPMRLEPVLDGVRQFAPGLKALLDRGTPEQAEPSPSALLCRALGIVRQQDWPVAALAARADGLALGDAYWLRLDPAHLEVGMGGLMLRPAAELDLGAAEAAALAASLGGLGLELRAPTATRWYLALAEAPDLTATPLDQVAGEYLTEHLPRGRDARRLMALVNEAQMLLHEHPVNRAREDRGLAPVNGLWLWGGGRLPAPAPGVLGVASDDAELRALAQGAGAAVRAAPARLVDFDTGPGHGFVSLAPTASDADLADFLGRLERDWCRPLLARLKSGRLGRLDLHLRARPGQAVSLDSLAAWRFWR